MVKDEANRKLKDAESKKKENLLQAKLKADEASAKTRVTAKKEADLLATRKAEEQEKKTRAAEQKSGVDAISAMVSSSMSDMLTK